MENNSNATVDLVFISFNLVIYFISLKKMESIKNHISGTEWKKVSIRK